LHERGLGQIHEAVCLLTKTLTRNALVGDEGSAVLNVVQLYTRASALLLAYDEDRLPRSPARPQRPEACLSLREARSAIRRLRSELVSRQEATELFGLEHGDQLAGIVGAVEQTFDGKPVYQTAQERGAHLLYFTSKIIHSPMATSGLGCFCFWNTFA
jgi:hypothetical protein